MKKYFRLSLYPLSIILITVAAISGKWALYGISGLMILIFTVIFYSHRKQRVRYWVQGYKSQLLENNFSKSRALKSLKQEFCNSKHGKKYQKRFQDTWDGDTKQINPICDKDYYELIPLLKDIIIEEFNINLNLATALKNYDKWRQELSLIAKTTKKLELEINAVINDTLSGLPNILRGSNKDYSTLEPIEKGLLLPTIGQSLALDLFPFLVSFDSSFSTWFNYKRDFNRFSFVIMVVMTMHGIKYLCTHHEFIKQDHLKQSVVQHFNDQILPTLNLGSIIIKSEEKEVETNKIFENAVTQCMIEIGKHLDDVQNIIEDYDDESKEQVRAITFGNYVLSKMKEGPLGISEKDLSSTIGFIIFDTVNSSFK